MAAIASPTHLSADGHWWWDGRAWQPTRPAAPAAGASAPAAGEPARATGGTWHSVDPTMVAIAAIAIGGLMVLGAVAGSALGRPSAAELRSEARYQAVFQRDLLRVQADSVPFAATATSPGVCNRGGSKQGCFDTNERVINDLWAAIADLSALPAPARYQEADHALQTALRADAAGLRLRDLAIASGDPNASLQPSNAALAAAQAQLHGAYALFPQDAAPRPRL